LGERVTETVTSAYQTLKRITFDDLLQKSNDDSEEDLRRKIDQLGMNPTEAKQTLALLETAAESFRRLSSELP
jgi:DNA recombination-dependent growth factor C